MVMGNLSLTCHSILPISNSEFRLCLSCNSGQYFGCYIYNMKALSPVTYYSDHTCPASVYPPHGETSPSPQSLANVPVILMSRNTKQKRGTQREELRGNVTDGDPNATRDLHVLCPLNSGPLRVD
jgi:hypothetical protein